MSPRQHRGVASRLKLALQHLLPHHLLTRVVGAAASWQWRPWSRALIRWFARAYRVDMSEAAAPDPSDYPSFNAFFTRPLRRDARSWGDDGTVIGSPVDGVVSRLDTADGARLVQAKGLDYDLADLLGDEGLADRFRDGALATLYLSPSHYHRVHMPTDGSLLETRHVPGRLFSVAPFTVQGVPRLFCRNERLVCLFDTPWGRMAQILVGAMLVAGIETVWNGPHGHPRAARQTSFHPEQIRLPRGAEMGRFNMGSTVILLFEPGRVTWNPGLATGASVRLGQQLGIGVAPVTESP